MADDDETTDDEAKVQSQIPLKPGISLSVKVTSAFRQDGSSSSTLRMPEFASWLQTARDM